MLTPTAVTKIHYIVVHPTPKPDEVSVLQGYGRGILDTIVAFEQIARLPLDVLDFARSWDEVLTNRMKGDGCGILPLQLDALQAFLSLQLPFVCVCSHRDVSADVEYIIQNERRPIYHVGVTGEREARGDVALQVVETSTIALLEEKGDAISGLSYERLFEYVMEVLSFLEAAGRPMSEMGSSLRQRLAHATSSRPPASIRGPSRRNHFVTAPTEAALEATGFAMGAPERPPWGGTENYVQAIVDAAQPLVDRRNAMLDGSPTLRFFATNDVIVAVPSLLARWYERQHRRFKAPPGIPNGETATSLIKAVADAIASQAGYTVDIESAKARNLFKNPAGVWLMRYRSEEIRAFTAQLAARAAADATPVLRLPFGINRSRHQFARVAVAARSAPSANRIRKLNRFARELSSALDEVTPIQLKNVIGATTRRVKIVADAPLEWLPIGATPLMLRTDCSRIPSTPGNTSFGLTVGGHEKIIPLAALEEVLVIRSYNSRDRIRLVLEDNVRTFLKRAGAAIRVRVVDVASVDEMCSALDSFSGALFVFDGHGRAGTSTEPGSLIIGGKPTDLWKLRGRVRVPPIAILSACDTHAFDGSHETPAHALLVSGADTVVSTTLPIDAHYASVFVARLLYRVDTYLPVMLSGPNGIARWSEILPGLQRMNFTSEMVQAISGKNGIRPSGADDLRAGWIANVHINGGLFAEGDAKLPPRVADLYAQTLREERQRVEGLRRTPPLRTPDIPEYPFWLDATLERMALDTGAPRDVINATVREWAWITDALKYVQLGNPERLLVVRDPLYAPSQHTGLAPNADYS